MNEWYFPRTKLAMQYLKILDAGISSTLSIIAPLRKGKTLFLLNDMATLSKKEGYFPIYASLWQDIDAPHQGLIKAFDDALHVLNQKIPFHQLLQKRMTKASVGSDLIGKVALEFSQNPEKPDHKSLLMLDKQLSELEEKVKDRTLLLLIDEIQHLATNPTFNALTHTLRTILDKRQGRVKAIFTGSSRHYMNLLLNDASSPFFHFSEIVPFPELGEDFIDFILKHLKTNHQITVDKKQLFEAFVAMDYSPYWVMKVISRIITYNDTTEDAINYVKQLMVSAEGLCDIAKSLNPIDQIVFIALSKGIPPFSKEVLEEISEKTSHQGTPSNVQRSLERLLAQNLISRLEKGSYRIEKPSLRHYLTLKTNNIN